MTVSILFFFLLIPLAYSGVSSESLIKFAEGNAYNTNKQTIIKDGMFGASKNCCTKDSSVIIEAFKKKDASNFKQVAMSCRQCGVKTLSKEQLESCKEEFSKLYFHLFGEKLDYESLVKGKGRYGVRVKESGLKCDSQGGADLRLDVFPQ